MLEQNSVLEHLRWLCNCSKHRKCAGDWTIWQTCFWCIALLRSESMMLHWYLVIKNKAICNLELELSFRVNKGECAWTNLIGSCQTSIHSYCHESEAVKCRRSERHRPSKVCAPVILTEVDPNLSDCSNRLKLCIHQNAKRLRANNSTWKGQSKKCWCYATNWK